MKFAYFVFVAIGLSIILFAAIFFLYQENDRDSAQVNGEFSQVEFPPLDVYWRIMDNSENVAKSALDRVMNDWRPGSAIMLLEILRWQEKRLTGNLIKQALVDKLGLAKFEWDAVRQAVWAGENDPHPDLPEFMARALSLMDPRLGDYFFKDVPSTIRLDQVVWGGVVRDGIPPLREPKMLAAIDATYLSDSDVVFGVEINGDTRAFPMRILAWHEMFRDTIGEVPVAGVYCTLCGTVIIYEREFNGVIHDLGTSGLLYQSNKLMYDAETISLWSTMTGKPVVGPLVGKGIALNRRPVVTTNWGVWKQLHPETLVLSLDTGHQRDYGEGVAYAAYFASDELMFPVAGVDDRLKLKDAVLGLRNDDGEQALAFSFEFLKQNLVVHDQLAGKMIVVLTDSSGASRVFDCGDHRFREWDNGEKIRDEQGLDWIVSETGLTGPGGKVLDRVPAHRSYWFGWYAAFPNTRLVK